MKSMSLKLECGENVITAYLSGELDHHATKTMRDEIDETIDRIKPKELTLDFKDVTFMDSSGIGLVMGRYRSMQMIGGRLVVTNTSLHIRKVMRLAGLDRLANID
jgi:stage II sporulation protein AA (anti-sigma F factor antagonist)